MPTENDIKATRIQLETPDSPLSSPISQSLMPRRFKHYILSERELHSVGTMSAAGSLFTALFGIALGAAISLGITLKTVDIPLGKTYTAFWAVFIVSIFSSIVFGGLSILMCVRSFFDVRTIKRESEERQREILGS